MAGVRISNLTQRFDGREVFGGLDFAFDGSCLAVVGPNASGKSTLLRILAGLLTPTVGEAKILLDGEEIQPNRARPLIGLAAPEVQLYSELSARENIGFVLRARGLSDINRRVDAALERVELTERCDDAVGELSSGLRQRAAIAAAIAHEPAILLLDEPSSNLDESGIRMLHRIVEQQRARGLVVIATNDPEEAALGLACLDLGAVR